MHTPVTMTDAEWEVARQFIRLGIATYILGQMIDTPTAPSADMSAKERKVKAAFEYADLLMRG